MSLFYTLALIQCTVNNKYGTWFNASGNSIQYFVLHKIASIHDSVVSKKIQQQRSVDG